MDEGFNNPAALQRSLRKVWNACLDRSISVKEFKSKYIVPLLEDLISKGGLRETAISWAMKEGEVFPWTLGMRAAGRFG